MPRRNFRRNCFSNLDEYELGLNPKICQGNLDCDWDIDFVDYAKLTLRWLNDGCISPNWCEDADLDRNGNVNVFDSDILFENWLMEL